MIEQSASVWLNSARPVVLKAAIGAGAIVAALGAWMIIGQLFATEPYSIPSLLEPSESLLVQTFVVMLLIAVVLVSVYFSDFKGSIEQERTGPFDIVSLVFGRITMILIAFLVCVMFYEVVVRYVFEKPTLWANELSLWTACLVFMLAGLYAMQQRSHIRIYIIYDMMPRWMQKASDVLSVSLIFIFATAMVWGSYKEAHDKFLRWETLGTAFDPPIPATMKPMLLFIVVLVAFQALSNLIADWNKAPEHHTPMDDIDETEIEELRQLVGSDEDK